VLHLLDRLPGQQHSRRVNSLSGSGSQPMHEASSVQVEDERMSGDDMGDWGAIRVRGARENNLRDIGRR